MTEKEFRICVMPVASRMYAVARGVLGDEDSARDCVQESLARLWRHRDRLDGLENVEGYCVTVVRREAIDVLRKRSRMLPNAGEDVCIDVSDNGYTERGYDARDSLESISDLLTGLSAPQRRVVEMSGLGGLSNEEIATATGYSPSNVRSLLSRGRRKLKELLSEREEYEYGRNGKKR